ncbi:MAG: Adenylate cyclase 2 [Betaproteobacteria bacterium ADurb.Bin341]|nr:MAG: Adenylate cyclase 2 [Betaproteobacteria bacterium ADurb.Bin341]
MDNDTMEQTGTKWTTKALALPVLLFGLLIGYLAWVATENSVARAAYVVGFLLIAYWLYTPKSPRHIIIRQILSLCLIWGCLVIFAFTWAMFEARPELFGKVDAGEMQLMLTSIRLSFGFWGVVFALGAFFASRRIYRSLERNLQLSGLFSRYVPPSVIAQMLKSEEDFFKTHKVELSVMFVDLRGFTAASANLTAEQVKELINVFMGIMIPLAHSWRGTVDKTVGDEIMVLFGAPIAYADHADQAVKTALAFLKAHAEVNAEWQKRGLPSLQMGIGINTGEMAVGNIGCKERVDYTVLGHHVNLGARLCGKAAGSQILISEYTRAHLSEELKRLVPPENYLEIEAKGIAGTVKAYSVNTAPG